MSSQPDTLEQKLLAAAEDVRRRAHAPYSRFPVGAAILADDGKIYAGCNVENAAYHEGNCAETSAIAAMVAGGGRRIDRVLVVGPGDRPVTPCGGCRQRIREFAAPDTPITCCAEHGDPLRVTLEDLLPHSFGPGHLETNP
jgi:cytidine deaminase